MTNLWWINHYAISPDQPGGTRHYDMGTELTRRGHHVTLFASDINLSLRQHMKLKPGQRFLVEPYGDVNFVWVWAEIYQGNNWRRFWNMLTFAWNFRRVALRMDRSSRPDVIIGSSPHPFAALAAAHVARRLKSRFFLELRDLWPQALVDMGDVSEKHPAVRVMRKLEKNLYSRAEKIIILAEGSREYLLKKGVPPERIVYLPNGVHLGHFQALSSREEARAKYNLSQFTFVYTGAHGPANNLETILTAAQLLKGEPLEFLLVGDGPAKAALMEKAKVEGITNVRFIAPIPKEEIPTLLLAADVGVITLKNAQAFAYGVSPNKLFDYMGAKLPVLCSVPGDMAKLVRQAQAGIVSTPENPESLADAALTLFRLSYEERRYMGEEGYAYIAQNFCRETLVECLEGLLHDL